MPRGGGVALRLEPTAIPAVKVVVGTLHGDERGALSEVYRADAFEAAWIGIPFVQDNQAWTAAAGTVRGLHFQIPPHAQAKLVRVGHGRILDVSVDLRHGSPTFGRHVAMELSRENGRQVLVPEGFAHGYCTLEPDTVVEYRLSSYYRADAERGLLWSDPALGIDWPVEAGDARLSDRDRRQPRLAELPEYFRID